METLPPGPVPKADWAGEEPPPRQPAGRKARTEPGDRQQAGQNQRNPPHTPPRPGPLPDRRPGPEALGEPDLETERRLETRYHLEHRVGRDREPLHLGLALLALLEVGERLGPFPADRDPKRKLGELARVALAT